MKKSITASVAMGRASTHGSAGGTNNVHIKKNMALNFGVAMVSFTLSK